MDHYHRRGQNRLNDADSSDGGNSALATEVFDHFCTATTLKNVLGLYREMCDILKLRPTNFPLFYPRLKSKLRSWKAQALWKRLDIRAAHKCYDRGRVCLGTRVLVIGAGPCGLRAAIEAQLLGAKVVVIEKRDRITRNNVLHLWPFVIQDLRALGAKKFFGKFCAGAIDHISIRQLQCILLKVALLLGVELHEGVSFEKLISPTSHEQADRHGWRADVLPADHPVSHYEFDVLIGADGKRNTLEGFKRKEFRGKLAIAITANFKNRHTEAEARVEEISGVAFIFNQKFFKDLYAETGIDLENIVYYKDDTHYFVMTAKKHSLIEKGVIMQDLQDTAKLLAQENVDRDALMEYAREAAEFSTNYQLPDLEFAVNHYGQPDVAMFDFTSMYAAENASRVVERYGYRLLMCLVGDSLLEPFWPTGSGCARGFLSSLDSCWAIRSWGSGSLPLEVLAERESIYRLLGQTTPENLQRDYASYTLDPSSRYPNLNRFCVIPAQVRGLYDSDDPSKIEIPSTAQHVTDKLHGISDLHKKRRKRDSQVHPDTLLHWIKKQVAPYESIIVDDITESFNNGLVLCAVIHRYRPDLIDWGSLVPEDIAKNNQLAFDILEKEMGIPPVMTGLEIEQNTVSDKLTVLSYLSQVYDTFHGEIPHIKHLRLDIREELKKQQELISVRPKPISEIKLHTKDLPSSMSRTSNKYTKTSHMLSAERKRKRRSADKGAEERRAEIAQNRSDRMSRRKMQRHYMTDQFYKSIHMLNTNAKISEDNGPFEDYSIYLYRQVAPNFEDRVKELEQKLLYPDREQRTQEFQKGSIDENFSGRIKNIEQKFKTKSGVVAEKKPPDLLRAIGKIESTDWNIREIEKKMLENKMGKKFNIAQEKEKVPKWSREQFVARQSKLEKKALNRQDSATEKFSAIDSSVKELDKKLKEGSVLEKGIRGNNKVASMAEQFNTKPEIEKSTTIQKSTSKSALSLCAKGGSELCHFCGNRVYLMERLSAEGRFFHRGCFRCQYCATSLRLGFYSYDAQNGQKFYCPQHFGMQGKLKVSDKTQKLVIKQSINTSSKEVTDMPMETVKNKGGKTPERIEFSNSIAVGHVSENEEPLSQIDEDEWTDRNFGQSTAEAETSDTTDSDSDEVYDDAFEAIDHGSQLENTGIPLLNISQKKHDNSHGDDSGASDDYDLSSDGFSYYEYSSDDDDASETATEEEEEIKAARELRKQEVQFSKPPPTVADTDTTGSDTEVIIGQSTLENVSFTPYLNVIPEKTILNSSEEISQHMQLKNIQPDNIHNLSDFKNTSQEINFNGLFTLSDETSEMFQDNNLTSNSLPDLINPLEFDNCLKLNMSTSTVFDSCLNKSSLINKNTQINDDNYNKTKDSLSSFENKSNNSLNSKCPNIDNCINDSKKILSEPLENELNILPNNLKILNTEPLSPLVKVSKSSSNIQRLSKQFSHDVSNSSILIIPKTIPKPKNTDHTMKSSLILKPDISLEDTKKYFGETNLSGNKTKNTVAKNVVNNKPLRHVSLNEITGCVKNEEEISNTYKNRASNLITKNKNLSFEFEPLDEDIQGVDSYIETLLTYKDISEIPVPTVPVFEENEKADEIISVSDSIENLLKALEMEMNTPNDVFEQSTSKEKQTEVNDLLHWMNELDYTPVENKLYRSYSGTKYNGLETKLKTQKPALLIGKMPPNTIHVFEKMLQKNEKTGGNNQYTNNTEKIPKSKSVTNFSTLNTNQMETNNPVYFSTAVTVTESCIFTDNNIDNLSQNTDLPVPNKLVVDSDVQNFINSSMLNNNLQEQDNSTKSMENHYLIDSFSSKMVASKTPCFSSSDDTNLQRVQIDDSFLTNFEIFSIDNTEVDLNHQDQKENITKPQIKNVEPNFNIVQTNDNPLDKIDDLNLQIVDKSPNPIKPQRRKFKTNTSKPESLETVIFEQDKGMLTFSNSSSLSSVVPISEPQMSYSSETPNSSSSARHLAEKLMTKVSTQHNEKPFQLQYNKKDHTSIKKQSDLGDSNQVNNFKSSDEVLDSSKSPNNILHKSKTSKPKSKSSKQDKSKDCAIQ